MTSVPTQKYLIPSNSHLPTSSNGYQLRQHPAMVPTHMVPHATMSILLCLCRCPPLYSDCQHLIHYQPSLSAFPHPNRLP
jgi:hypothetical protein